MEIRIEQITYQLTWPIRHQVMWPDKTIDFVKLPDDENGIHFAVWKNNKIASVVSLFISNQSAQFRKLATVPSEQGNGHATALITHLINYLKSESIETLWCNARIEKVNFYSKFGFIETSKTFIKDGQGYILMEMNF